MPRPFGLRRKSASAASALLAVPVSGTCSSPLLASIRFREQRGSREVLIEALRDQAGQMIAEYGVLMWLVTLIGVATLATFFFAFEEGVIGYYEDIVNIVCLPIP
jgi:Flp pilus assembly pilin Flp